MGKSVADQQADWRQRDVELVRLVSQGMGNKGIAQRLGVSETAIKKRLGALMKRACVDNRAALVRAAFVAGVIDPSEHG